MKVAIIFEAPDELAGANLSPEEFLRAYNERLFDIKITGIDMPKHYNLAEKKQLSVAEIVEHSRRLQEEIEAQAIVPNLSDERIGTDGSFAAMEARDRRQQHKFAVKFSNRRK